MKCIGLKNCEINFLCLETIKIRKSKEKIFVLFLTVLVYVKNKLEREVYFIILISGTLSSYIFFQMCNCSTLGIFAKLV